MNGRVHQTCALLLAFVMCMVAIPSSLAAQEATPGASLLEGLGLPILEVTVTSEGIELPAEVAAGPMVVIGHNETGSQVDIDFVRLPDGVTVDDFLAVTTAEGGAFPEWVAEATTAGGVTGMPPGTSASVGLVLQSGEYSVIVTSEEPIAEPLATLTATGEADAASVDAVPADLAVDMGHYTFDFPDVVPAGPQVWKVTNSHEGVLHHVIVFQSDRLYTPDEVMEGIVGDFSGTPVPDGFSLFNVSPVDAAASPVISSGQSVWIEANMEPGYYVAICFLPDPGGDVPHVMQGMVDTFEVPAP